MTLPRVLKSIGLILAILAILVYIGYLAIYVTYAINLFQWPFDYDQGEGFELYDAILYSQGEWPYRDNNTYPFYASNYPPLFHLLIVPLLPIFGQRVIAGRIVSFVATLITAATIGFVVQRKVKGWLIPTISGLAFLASNYVYQLGPLCRMHMTMVMFETLAIAFIAEFEHPKHGTRNLIIGLIMLLCAGYSKQMAVFTVGAAIFYIFLRDIKKAIVSGVALTLAAGGIFWLLNVATDGQWWINTIQANVNAFDYQQTLFLFRQWFDLHALFAILAVLYLIYELFWDRLSAYSLWFLFALGTSALSGKWGAGFGYHTTAVAAACLTSGLLLGRVKHTISQENGLIKGVKDLFGGLKGSPLAERLSLNQAWRRVRPTLQKIQPVAPAILSILIPLLYLLQAPRMLHLPTSGPVFGSLARVLGVDDQLIEGHCTTFQYHDRMGYTQLGHLLTAEDYTAGQQILDYVHLAEDPAFSEEAMISLLADEPVITNPTQLLNLDNNNLLDTTEIVERIYNQEFGVVIFRAQFYPHAILEAIGQNYQPVDHVCMNGFYYHILWPNSQMDQLEDLPIE